MPTLRLLTPCLWFDGHALDAAVFYTSLFPDSGIDHVARTPGAGQEAHGREEGSVLTVAFHLGDQPMLGLNGAPRFTFTEAVSLVVTCTDQSEIDRYWDGLLTDGGRPDECGWLKDRFGVSWQVVPEGMGELMTGPGAGRAMEALLKMQKVDVAALEAAAG